jgi:hypothetical protein
LLLEKVRINNGKYDLTVLLPVSNLAKQEKQELYVFNTAIA